MSRNADQIAYWNEVAGDKWVRNQARLDRLMAPLGDALLEAAAPRPGERVLDIGCGCGSLALRLAAAVGAGGAVTAIDVSRPMLAHAAGRATDAGAPAIRWLEADAAVQPFAPEFDVLVSRFGVMFFDDRRRAFSNLRRALRPGGRFAFLTWRSRVEVEWMQAPLEWLEPLLPPPEPSDGEIGPFALADAETTCATLAAAGFRGITARPLDRAVTIGSDVEDALLMLGDTGPAAAAMRDAEPGERIEAERLLREHLRDRAGADGSVALGAACWIYEGEV